MKSDTLVVGEAAQAKTKDFVDFSYTAVNGKILRDIISIYLGKKRLSAHVYSGNENIVLSTFTCCVVASLISYNNFCAEALSFMPFCAFRVVKGMVIFMKVVFTGNFIRFQNYHNPTRYLFQLLNIPLKNLLKSSPEFIFPPFFEKNKENFFHDFYKGINDKWNLYQEENSSIPCELFESIFKGKDLIVGFEIPPSICAILSKEKIDYINIFIHPIRFMPDLIFKVATNSEKIAYVLEKWNVDLKREIPSCVDKIRGFCIKENIRQDFIKEGTTAIFAQTMHDASIIKNGKFLSLYDFKDEIKDKLKGCSEVIIVPHPYEKNIYPLISLIEYLQKGVLVNLNSYSLLCNSRIAQVMTLSSSIGNEAELFGKEVHFLLNRALKVGSSMIASDAFVVSLGQVIFKSAFWRDVLFGTKNYITEKKVLWDEKNFIRSIYGGWAYDEVVPSQQTFFKDRKWEILNIVQGREIHERNIKVVDVAHCLNVDFSSNGDGILYVGNGFSYPELWGTWTEGHNAELRLPMKASVCDYWLIELYAFITEKVKKQSISVYLEDNFLGSVSAELPDAYILKVPVQSMKDNNFIRLRFLLLDAVSPEQIGVSDDARKLGIRITSAQSKKGNIEHLELVLKEHEKAESQYGEPKQENEVLKSQYGELKQENEVLKSQYGELKQENEALKSQYGELRETCIGLNNDYKKLSENSILKYIIK